MKTDFLDPLSKYIGQFKEMKVLLSFCLTHTLQLLSLNYLQNRMEIRTTRRVDMDRYGYDAKSHHEKGSTSKASTSEMKVGFVFLYYCYFACLFVNNMV